MTVAITPVVQDTWPPRVALGVTGLTNGDLVRILRVVSGQRTPLRGTVDAAGNALAVVGTTLAAVDAEFPFGVPVSWAVEVEGTVAVTSTPATYDLTGGKVALTDAIQSLAAEVMVLAWPTKRRERRASTFNLTDSDGVGYTVVVAGAAGQFTGQIELATTTDTAADALSALLEACTGAVVQLRSATQPRNNCHIAVLGWDEARWSQDGTDPKRHWVLDISEVRGWALGLEARGWTYDDWKMAYVGQDYDTVEASYATYLDAQLADIGALL